MHILRNNEQFLFTLTALLTKKHKSTKTHTKYSVFHLYTYTPTKKQVFINTTKKKTHSTNSCIDINKAIITHKSYTITGTETMKENDHDRIIKLLDAKIYTTNNKIH